jgi:hypothetical protein
MVQKRNMVLIAKEKELEVLLMGLSQLSEILALYIKVVSC